MPPRIQHVVETRFSMREGRSPLEGPLGEERFSSAWLERRLELLQRYCLPSLAAQTTSDFTWALFCDEITDEEVLARLREHASTVPDLRIAITAGALGHVEALRGLIDSQADLLITTRLDSDDAVADSYLEATQEYAAPFLRSAHQDLLVNFPHGFRWDVGNEALYADCMECSSFHSLLERPRETRPQTVLHGGHPQLHYDHMTVQDESLAAWLIVVHEGNLINKIREGLPRVDRLPPQFSLDRG